MKLTQDQRVRIILLYGAENDFSNTMRRFNVEFEGVASISYPATKALVEKFIATGNVADLPCSGRPKTDEVTQLTVLGTVAINNKTSLRQQQVRNNIPKEIVRRVLKSHKFHPFKPSCLQQLFFNDLENRILFCETMLQKIAEDGAFLKHICFTDESTFFVNGDVNVQNVRFWATENPHELFETHTQYPEKLNVWAGIFGSKLIGPFFLDGTLNGERYLELLQETIDPFLTNIVETEVQLSGELVYDEEKITYQHDGCPAHFSRNVTTYLNENYPNRWIGRGGPIAWPPRSPDLTPLDFFLWGHLKSVIYKTQPTDLADLRQRIVHQCSLITPETLQKAREEFENRLYYCLQQNGGHFEHLI